MSTTLILAIAVVIFVIGNALLSFFIRRYRVMPLGDSNAKIDILDSKLDVLNKKMLALEKKVKTINSKK